MVVGKSRGRGEARRRCLGGCFGNRVSWVGGLMPNCSSDLGKYCGYNGEQVDLERMDWLNFRWWHRLPRIVESGALIVLKNENVEEPLSGPTL